MPMTSAGSPTSRQHAGIFDYKRRKIADPPTSGSADVIAFDPTTLNSIWSLYVGSRAAVLCIRVLVKFQIAHLRRLAS